MKILYKLYRHETWGLALLKYKDGQRTTGRPSRPVVAINTKPEEGEEPLYWAAGLTELARKVGVACITGNYIDTGALAKGKWKFRAATIQECLHHCEEQIAVATNEPPLSADKRPNMPAPKAEHYNKVVKTAANVIEATFSTDDLRLVADQIDIVDVLLAVLKDAKYPGKKNKEAVNAVKLKLQETKKEMVLSFAESMK